VTPATATCADGASADIAAIVEWHPSAVSLLGACVAVQAGQPEEVVAGVACGNEMGAAAAAAAAPAVADDTAEPVGVAEVAGAAGAVAAGAADAADAADVADAAGVAGVAHTRQRTHLRNHVVLASRAAAHSCHVPPGRVAWQRCC